MTFPLKDPGPELLDLVRAGRIPNAFLFTGAPGTGKHQAMLLLAKACNCLSETDRPCNGCTSCKKIAAGMHPDLIRLDLEPDKKIISIAQIREMGRQISARPNEARFRLVVIPQADQMNVQAQNGLLKVLEEPPGHTFFVLIARHRSKLLPTILSRCRHLRFQSRSVQAVQHCLTSEHGVSEDIARMAVETLGKEMNRLLTCLGKNPDQPDNWLETRQWLIEQLTALMTGRAGVQRGLAVVQYLCRTPDSIADALAVIRTMLRDLVIFNYSPEKIVNLDFFSAFEDISQVHGQPTFMNWMASFLETEKRLESNGSLRLALDRFFLQLGAPGQQHRVLTRILSPSRMRYR